MATIDTTAAQHQSLALVDHLSRMGRRRSEEVLAPLGLRPRLLVTLTLLRDHGAATQQSLAASLSIDPTNLVGLLNVLEQEGHVVRRRDPEDRRRHIVELSPGGAAVLQRAECALAGVQNEVFGALDEAERLQLYALLLRATGGHVPTCTEATQDLQGDC